MDLLEDSANGVHNDVNNGKQVHEMDENLLLNSDDEEGGYAKQQYSHEGYVNEDELLYEGDEDEYACEETDDVLNLEVGDEELDTPDTGSEASVAPVKVRSQYGASTSDGTQYQGGGNNSGSGNDGGNERTVSSPRTVSAARLESAGDSDDDEESPRHRSRFLSERKQEDISSKSGGRSSEGIPISSLGDKNPRLVQDARRGGRGGFGVRGATRHMGPRSMMPNANMRFRQPMSNARQGPLIRQPPFHMNPPLMPLPGGFVDFNRPMRPEMNQPMMPIGPGPVRPMNQPFGPGMVPPNFGGDFHHPGSSGPNPRRPMNPRMQNRPNLSGAQGSPNAFGGPGMGPQLPGPGPEMGPPRNSMPMQRQRFPGGNPRFHGQQFGSNPANRMPMGQSGQPLMGHPDGFNAHGPMPNGGPMRFPGGFDGPQNQNPFTNIPNQGPMSRFPGPDSMNPFEGPSHPNGAPLLNSQMPPHGGFAPPGMGPQDNTPPFFGPRGQHNGMIRHDAPNNNFGFNGPHSHPHHSMDFPPGRNHGPIGDANLPLSSQGPSVDMRYSNNSSDNRDNPFFKTSSHYRSGSTYDDDRKKDDRLTSKRSDGYHGDGNLYRESRRFSPDRDRRDYYDYERSRDRDQYDDDYGGPRDRDRYDDDVYRGSRGRGHYDDDDYAGPRRQNRRSSPDKFLARKVETSEGNSPARSPEKRLEGRLGPVVQKTRALDEQRGNSATSELTKESQTVMGLDDEYLRKIEEQKEIRARILREKEERRRKQTGGQDETEHAGEIAVENRRRPAPSRIDNSPKKKILSESELYRKIEATDSQKTGKSIYVNPKTFQGDLSALGSNLKVANTGPRAISPKPNVKLSSNTKGGSSTLEKMQPDKEISGTQKKRTILRIVRNKKGEIISKSKVVIMPKGSHGESTTEVLPIK